MTEDEDLNHKDEADDDANMDMEYGIDTQCKDMTCLPEMTTSQQLLQQL